MKKLLSASAAIAIAGFLAISVRSQNAPPAPRPAVTVLASFGLKATQPEQWNGSAKLANAKLLSIEGRHFSQGDSVDPAGSWTCKTRRDFVAPYADLHYTEMRPGSTPAVLQKPVGVYLTLDADPGARLTLETSRGNFDFPLADLSATPRTFADGNASVRIVPTAEKLTGSDTEDDEPSIAALPDGSIAVSWVAYRDNNDRVMLRTRNQGRWSDAEEVSKQPGDIFRTSLASTKDGMLWLFWSQREGQQWRVWLRQKPKGGPWKEPIAISGTESATFHRAASDGQHVYIVWQGFIGGQSDIFLAMGDDKGMSATSRMSNSSANDWEPAVAVNPLTGQAHVVWDSYDRGNYDIFYRPIGTGAPPQAITSSPRFQAHATVAVDSRNYVWIAWNESGVNWGKDQGFLIPTPLATPLHQQRWLEVVLFDGIQVRRTASPPPSMGFNAEHPQIMLAGTGAPTMIFRHWTRQQSRSIGSPIVWENYVTSFDGAAWSDPQPLPSSGGWIEKHAQLAKDPDGNLWAAWMTDNRPFATQIPGNSDVLAAKLSPAPKLGQLSMKPFDEKPEEAIGVHDNESADVKSIRDYTIEASGKKYRIFRGDMHRHTDFSQDFKYDGSLFEVYRYALDAAGFDYIAPTDHQAGYDQEFSWWQNQKYVDLFLMPGRFVPLFAYERSLQYPNGHRNIVWSQRGVRTFPIPPAEASGKEGAKKLYEHLRKTNGISMPHSSATAQGTDWRDNDQQIEPLVEIYQGYRASYEYEGAPKAATALNQHAQKSGWQPEGFWWNALDKGYKLGVQASSDHWSTHISYACLLTEGTTREALMDAIRARHAYAATDNIILDFRAKDGAGKAHIQGDIFSSAKPATLSVKALGTGSIKQIDLISNKRFLYTLRPRTREATFEFTDRDQKPGESWYYVRVMQEDGQIAWSSPVWITKPQ